MPVAPSSVKFATFLFDILMNNCNIFARQRRGASSSSSAEEHHSLRNAFAAALLHRFKRRPIVNDQCENKEEQAFPSFVLRLHLAHTRLNAFGATWFYTI